MKQKVFFFDYDGTLVDNKTKKAPDSLYTAFHKLKQEGHLLVLNTGRTKGILDPQVYDLPFDAMILGCGTYISYHQEVVLDVEIPMCQHQMIVDVLTSVDADVFLEGKQKIYISEELRTPDMKAMANRYQEMGISFSTVNDSSKSFSKLFVSLANSTAKQIVITKLQAYFACIDRGANRLELVPIGYSKATGIQHFCRYLGIDLKDCYAFGDSNNDLPMFELIENSILIGGENPELKSYVKYVSKSACEDGVFEALKNLGFMSE